MNWKKTAWLLTSLIPITAIGYGYIHPSSFFGNQDSIRTFVQSSGMWAPLVFIGIQILQVVVTPLNHYIIGFLGGFLFGTWYGFLYNWIGRVIGSLIAFQFGKTWGRAAASRILPGHAMSTYGAVVQKNRMLLFLMYFLPFFPDDELCYLAGISGVSWKWYVPVLFVGQVGGSLGLAYAGSGISAKDPIFIFLSLVTVAGGILFLKMKKSTALEE